MRPLLLIFIFLGFHSISFAKVNFDIIGPCAEKPLFSSQVQSENLKNVGAFTVNQLTSNGIEFIGAENKIESIDSTPVGQAALELISRSEMRAYGWCFYVNGKQPEVYPDEILMSEDIKSIKWVFAYAHYLKGEWLTMCEPSWQLKPEFLCAK